MHATCGYAANADIAAECVGRQPGGPRTYRLTKKHAAYAAHTARVAQQQELLDLLLPCLIHLLPLAVARGGATGSGGGNEEPPSAKAARSSQ
jgi:hypothetical protein